MTTKIEIQKRRERPGNKARKSQKKQSVRLRKALLFCGIASSLWYVGMNILVPVQFPGYSSASQVISELSAVDAPSRTLWVLLSVPYTLLVTAFGWGVWQSAGPDRRLQIAGILLAVYGALGILWPWAPMHLRKVLAAGGATVSDTLHIVLGVVTEILYIVALGYAAAALGKRFRVYSIITVAVLLVFGTLTFMDAPGIAANRPTPYIGIWERINIGVFLFWIIVLTIVLWQRKSPALSQTSSAS